MDKWMVAIAAGAGHIAQHFKKFQQAGERITSESSIHGPFSDKPDSPNQPSDKKRPFHMPRRRSLRNDDPEVKNEVSQVVTSAKMASANGFDGEKEIISGSYEGSDGILENVERGDLLHEPLTPRSRMSFRSRRTIRQAIRPLSSLERYLMAHVEMKEYSSSSFASPSIQTVRPFLVTDGSNVINKATLDSYIVQHHAVEKKFQSYSEEKTSSVDATLLVCLGISFGMLYSFMENKREVEKLHRLLKQKENLVQDLEEEIEMKDSLVMQELTVDDHKSQRTDCSVNDGSPDTVSHEHNNKDSVFMKANDDYSFSRIETELEAELERLELNMTSSTLERKISNLVELDPDFDPGVAHGELRADTLDNITTHSPNYAVSPRELSIRLHEVLQSQLEERIRELEAEIETRNQKSWKDFSSSDAGDEKHVDEPVVLNLSGEALDAYNEACNEFAKFDELDEEFDVDGTPQNGGGTGGDDLDFDEDEMEKLLIKHIVEKARQGSPAVLNAQRALFYE